MSSPALLDAVLSRSTGKGSRIHGPAHWASVAAAGLTLLDSTPDADPLTVLLFALFHDSTRRSDGHDPEHGRRGAELARQMREAGELELDEDRLAKLEEACTYHDKGKTSEDPTIGLCWDADRLNLWRVARRPDPALLSTTAARRMPEQASRMFAMLAFNWPALFAEFGARCTLDSVYLRFGDLPPCGTSTAYLFGARECGVSVYPGTRLADGSYVLDFRRPLLGIDTRFLSSLLWMGRPLYVVEGRQVGVGGCGEPVLEDARIVEEVPPREVGVLPDRPRFKKIVEAWRLKREGKDPGIASFFLGTEPDQRPAFPLVVGGSSGGWRAALEEKTREYLKAWGLEEDYDRMKAESRARRERSRIAKPAPQRQTLESFYGSPAGFNTSFNTSAWKEATWK